MAIKKHGLLPLYAKLCWTIASSAGSLAGMARKAWMTADIKQLPVKKVRSLRARINEAFDQLEKVLDTAQATPTDAIQPSMKALSSQNVSAHGNMGMLALSAIEDAAGLSLPLMQMAEGSRSLKEAAPEIGFTSADVRITLHTISEQARICPEKSTSGKWALIRQKYSDETFAFGPKIETPSPSSKSLSIVRELLA